MQFQKLKDTLTTAAIAAATLFGLVPAQAQLSSNMQQMLHRIESGEFSGGARGGGGRRAARATGGQWVDGGTGYTAVERNPDGNSEIVRYDTASGERKVVMSAADLTPPELGKPLQFSEHTASTDGKHVLFATNPKPTMIRKTAYDYWVLDQTDHSWRKLGGNGKGLLLYAKLSPDGTRAGYVRDNNIFVEDLKTGKITQLTKDGSPMIINGTSDWVNEEEFSIGDGFSWSPDGKKIAYFQFDQSGVPEFALINYTAGLYPTITKYPYPKAGQTNAAVRVGIVNATGGATRWIKTPGDPRNTYIARMDWVPNSDSVVLQHLNRLQNTNTVYVIAADSSVLVPVYVDSDKTWVDYNDSFIWIQNGKRLLFQTEGDGWRHVWAVAREGGQRTLITKEPFDLIGISAVDEAGGWLYFIASPDNATQRYLYRTRLDGTGKAERVTPADQPGTHTYNISPDAHFAFHTYSKFDDPGVSDLISLPDHKVVRTLQDNADLRAKSAPILAGRTELLQVDVGDGTKMDGWLIKPSKMDASKKYPLILYVYGEPAATTVNDSWGGATRLLLATLADDGYLVASFDNHGTPSPKGRAWRKAVYGDVGVLASKEQAAAVRALAAIRPVDLDRVGVFGWSGGGSMTLNLMFRSPELFKVGVAGAPVADQALYDSIYQERYMGLPQTNPDGFKAGSPINFAEGLRGKLLIIHGTGDDNVHFQGTQKLLNRLIELNKQFSFMEYPNRRHGITGTHLETLRFGFFEEYLPAGGR